MALVAELEAGYSLYYRERIETLEEEEMRSELPHIFGLHAACSVPLWISEQWLPQTQQLTQCPSYRAYSPRYGVLSRWIGQKMPNSPIRLERNRFISSAGVPALESSHHLLHLCLRGSLVYSRLGRHGEWYRKRTTDELSVWAALKCSRPGVWWEMMIGS